EPSQFEGRRSLGRAPRQARAQRVFQVLVRNHMKRDEEVARYCTEHGVTNDDLVLVRVIVPFEIRPGETARDAYIRELASIAEARGETRPLAEKATGAAGCTEKASGREGRGQA